MPPHSSTDYTDDNHLNQRKVSSIESVKEVGKCNILVIGKTGVGKSTLINAVFGEYSAKTGVGRRITESIQKYEKKGSLVTVYDTPGLQLFSAEEIATIRHKVSQLIEKEPIYAVWYCINAQGNRWEEIEEDWIRDMARQKVPIILLLTKALPDNDSDLLGYLKKQKLPVIDVIPVLAEPLIITTDYIVAAHGLELLVEVTASTLPEVARNAFIRGQRIITNPELPEVDVPVEPPEDKSLWKKVAAFAAGILGMGALGIVALVLWNNSQEDSEDNENNTI